MNNRCKELHDEIFAMDNGDRFIVNKRFKCTFKGLDPNGWRKDENCARKTFDVDVEVYDSTKDIATDGMLSLIIDEDLSIRENASLYLDKNNGKWTTSFNVIDWSR